MADANLKAHIEAAYDRIVEALILMEGVAGHTAHSNAQDIVGLLGKVDREMFKYRGKLYQHQKI